MQFAVSAGIVLAIILSVVGAALWLRRDGRRAAEGDIDRNTLEATADAQKAADAVRSNPGSDRSERLRSKYQRD